MPCELVQHFSPASPLLVGGVLPAEEGSGHLQLRLKRHRWFPRILKTRDPLVFSIGAPSPACNNGPPQRDTNPCFTAPVSGAFNVAYVSGVQHTRHAAI